MFKEFNVSTNYYWCEPAAAPEEQRHLGKTYWNGSESVFMLAQSEQAVRDRIADATNPDEVVAENEYGERFTAAHLNDLLDSCDLDESAVGEEFC